MLSKTSDSSKYAGRCSRIVAGGFKRMLGVSGYGIRGGFSGGAGAGFSVFRLAANSGHIVYDFARCGGCAVAASRDQFTQPEFLKVPAFLSTHWASLVAAGQLVVVCGVLLGSLTYQFALGELPCPLCVIQRLAFLLTGVGPIGILRRAVEGRSDRALQARGFAMTILAAMVGAAASARQILLHIVPPDPGYGPPVLGLHLYSWALLVFACLIASSALGLFGLHDHPTAPSKVSVNLLCGLAVLIGMTIAVATFLMQGFNFLLPGDPARYELLRTFER
jgi:disulfide bond formation protein DsbB